MADRETLLLEYLETLPYEPFPVQEDALLRYFEDDAPGGGVLICAPTGTGKTLIAEGALYEALKTDTVAYYTTPLIALTDQKFAELQDAAERWGFDRDQVGLVTGNRSVNPHANVLVVVAEILFNRLLHPDDFRFDRVSAVVMDEFHSFAEPGRGMVWELSLALMPGHVRLMLLSATVGNAAAFLGWLRESHGRRLTLVQSSDRKVPLEYAWVGDTLLPDHIADMADGGEALRRTPALVFCFDRERCWAVAEVLRGKDLLRDGQQATLAEKLEAVDFDTAAGPKLKRLLLRGVGVHHAGLLPRYKRVVESLFQAKLLSICVCTETLAAGMNLPARSVVLTELMKGPRDRKKLIAASQAQQIFGRAGRPAFDDRGYVFAVAHDDDVKIARHKQKIEQIPEDSKDPQLMKARKRLIKKSPKRRDGVAYSSPAQFESLQTATPGDLVSRGNLPWRLLAFMLDASPEVAPIRAAVDRRLMPPGDKAGAQKNLTRMLRTLHDLGVVELEPPPPAPPSQQPHPAGESKADDAPAPAPAPDPLAGLTLGGGLGGGGLGGVGQNLGGGKAPASPEASDRPQPAEVEEEVDAYAPARAVPTPRLQEMLSFRAVNPLFGVFLLDRMGQLEPLERLQILEGMLELPRSVAGRLRPPRHEDAPPSDAVQELIDRPLIEAGLFTHEELYPPPPYEQDLGFGERPRFPVELAEKVRLLFADTARETGPLVVVPAYAAGALFELDGDFKTLIQTRDLAHQEGLVFRHLLRLILLCDEFRGVRPAGLEPEVWEAELTGWQDRLTACCRAVDPQSTDETL